MAEEAKRPRAVYEPGELARTRDHLGELNPEEAMEIARRLGGTVGVEKTAPINPGLLKRAKRQSPAVVVGGVKSRESGARKSTPGSGAPVQTAEEDPFQQTPRGSSLPAITPKEQKKMDLVMMSPEFQIKKSYGIFNGLYFLFTRNQDTPVLHSFARRTLMTHLSHLRTFSEIIFNLVKETPVSYRKQISESPELKFRFLKKLSLWSKMLPSIESQYNNLKAEKNTVSVETLTPLVRSVYWLLLPVYYLGISKVQDLLKTIFNDAAAQPDAKVKVLMPLMRSAAAEWEYIYDKIIIGMYPLLMRICSTRCMEAGKFFTTETGQIFPFVGITKYDILTPEKNQSGPAGEQEGYGGEEETPENNPRRDPAGTEAALAERNQKLEAERLERYKLAEKGLKFLDILFPEAYWLDLGPAADLFPYFQPLYQFPDGFNLLSPENPVQVIIVLLRIIEDFFRGCRNVEFRLPEDSERNTEWFTQAMTDWMGYREVLFEKNYSTDLKDYVNNLYSKPDFQHSAIGKKLMFNLLWQTKSYFLPFFKVDQIAFEKPSREASTLTPLHRRVRELRDVFEALSEMVDVTAVNRGPVAEIPNAWEKYKFDLDNVVSVRLDALLGAKKNSPIAVNANVVKHTASILAVLDWWINDETSPAHASNDFRLFRVSPLDGRPMFSVPLLTNQSELFRQGLKKLAAQQAPAPQEAPQQAAPAPQTAAPQQTQPQNAGQSG